MLPSDRSESGANLALGWLVLATAAVAASSLFAILIVMARVPGLGALFPGTEFYRVALTLHVDLSQWVWFMAFAATLWSLAARRRPAVWHWLALALATVGAVMMAVSPALGAIRPLMSNYVPVLDSPWFLAGLGIYGIAVLMVVRPTAIAPEGATPKRATDHPRAMLGLFAAGLYGGFVHGGVGFVLLMVLAGTLHYDLVRANALKMLCTLVSGVASLVVFLARGQIAWAPALVLAVATSVGSVLGVKYAVKADPKKLKRLVAVLVVLACLGVAAQELWGG